MTMGLNFATLVMASLIVSIILVAAVSIPTTAQKSSGSLSGDDITSSLQSAKIHLTEATKNIKMDNSQAALMQINMTRQAITLAGLKSNATIICNNMRNEGYCVAP
jgi:ATP-dependent helicase/DNAse subunit B